MKTINRFKNIFVVAKTTTNLEDNTVESQELVSSFSRKIDAKQSIKENTRNNIIPGTKFILLIHKIENKNYENKRY
jgi:hypothetical protein